MNIDSSLNDTSSEQRAAEDREIADLLERIARRDEAAFKRLHGMFARRVYSFVLTRLRQEDLAESVMIDTLFDVWQHPERFRFESRFSTWLLGIARHKALDALRSRRRDEHEDIEDHVDTIPDERMPVHAFVELRQSAELLSACLQRLNPEQRGAVELVYGEGMTLSEVAAIQKVPEGTVKTRLHHARRTLKECVQRQGGGW